MEEKSKKVRHYRILKELRPSEYKIGQEINVNEIGFQLFFFLTEKAFTDEGKRKMKRYLVIFYVCLL